MPEIGQTISHYRIIEKLGQGGMGEVFLAHDTSLDRKVALKFLPDIFSGDPERLARFEREAKLLASLNHPNIATIYGLEQADGKRFLAMELVEGETLAQQIERGPLQLGVGVPERQSEAANLPCNKAQVSKKSVTSDRIQR
jgi:serine/threonine protein kinase